MNQMTNASASGQLKVCDLAATLKRMGSNVELARQVLDFFREDAPAYQTRLHEAISRKDAVEVEKAAHALRGMLSTFGAEAAMHVAQRLEWSGREHDLTSAPTQIHELDAEISRFLETVTSELAQL